MTEKEDTTAKQRGKHMVLNIGDVVRLNSAGEPMTVADIKGDQILVLCQSGSAISGFQVHRLCLTKINLAASPLDQT